MKEHKKGPKGLFKLLSISYTEYPVLHFFQYQIYNPKKESWF